jgi:hypothetical protein
MISCCRKPSISPSTRPSLILHHCHQPIVRDGVEVAFQVGVHHVGVASLQQPIDFPQRILAAPPRPEAEAAGPELDFKDWLDDHLNRRLNDPVLHRRYPQRPGLIVRFGDLHTFDRLRPIAAIRQAGLEFGKVPFRTEREPFHALAVHTGGSPVPRDAPPREVQGRRTDDLINQAEPFASFDAVTQRRHHAVRPDRSFCPPQILGLSPGGFSPLFSLIGTRGTLLLHSEPLASSFLPPFPRIRVSPSLSTARSGRGIMKALTPTVLTQTGGSPRLRRLAVPTFRPQTTWAVPRSLYPSRQRRRLFQASPSMSRLATAPRRNRFVILRTVDSPPVALHPALRRRSYLQSLGCDQPMHGLAPCRQSVLTDALVAS